MSDDSHVLKPTNLNVNKARPNQSSTDRFGQVYKADDDSSKWSNEAPQESRRAHVRSDVDLGPRSLHHTIGTGRNQASAGDHVHDGVSSKLLGPLEMDPSNLGDSRPVWTMPEGYSVDDIVEFLSNFSNFRLLGTGAPGIQRSVVNISFASAGTHTQAVTFPFAYTSGAIPTVVTNINSSASTTSKWTSRAISVTNTGFSIYLQKGNVGDPDTAWSNIPVQWAAFT